MKCMDWTLEQWAEAEAWFARSQGWSPMPNMDGAARVRGLWMSLHDAPPDSRRLVEKVPRSWPSRTSLERAVAMCDDPRECQRLKDEYDRLCRLPSGIEMNYQWARLMFVRVAIDCFPTSCEEKEHEV